MNAKNLTFTPPEAPAVTSMTNLLPEDSDRVISFFKELKAQTEKVSPLVQSINDALAAFGQTGEKTHLEDITAKINLLKSAAASGTITQLTYNRAWVKYIEDLNAAGAPIDAATMKLYRQTKAQFEQLQANKQAISDIRREVTKTFDGMARSIADSVVQWKGLGQTALGVLRSLGSGIIEILVKGAFHDLAKSVLGIQTQAAGLAGIFKGLFGGGGGVVSLANLPMSNTRDLAAYGAALPPALAANTTATVTNSAAATANTAGDSANTAAVASNSVATIADVAATSVNAGVTAAAAIATAANTAAHVADTTAVVSSRLITNATEMANNVATTANTTALAANTGAIAALASALGASAAGNVASTAGTLGGAGKAVAGAVGSGLAGTLTAVFSGLNALFSGIGMFQNMHMETSLNAIEHNTRYAMMYLGERSDGGILGTLFKINEEIAWGANTKATEQMKDALLNWIGGGGKGGGGNTYSFDFRGATFGAGTSQASITQMFQAAFDQALAAHGG